MFPSLAEPHNVPNAGNEKRLTGAVVRTVVWDMAWSQIIAGAKRNCEKNMKKCWLVMTWNTEDFNICLPSNVVFNMFQHTNHLGKK